jgi:hypothetical protein
LGASYTAAIAVANTTAQLAYSSVDARWQLTHDMVMNGNLIPAINTSYELGNITAPWGNLAVGNILTANVTSDTHITDTLNVTTGATISSTANSWIFNNTGVLTAPSGARWSSSTAGNTEYITSTLDGFIDIQSVYADGNLASELHLEHGFAHILINNGTPQYWEFDDFGDLTTPGNILPDTSNVYSLGSATNQWADLWVSNATIYMNSVPITLGAGNVLTVNGEAVLSNDSNTSISTTGNISADNGSFTTAVTARNINADNGNISLNPDFGLIFTNSNAVVTANSQSWIFGTDGNLTIPGSSGGLIKTVANASIGIAAMDNGTDNPAQLMSWNVNAVNPNTIISAYQGNALIQTDVNGSIKTWTFSDTGSLTLPGNLVVATGIVANGASPAPFLNGFSSVSAQNLSASGNVTSNTVSASGNI